MSLVTHGWDYASHDGNVAQVPIDPATGALPPRLLCTGPNPDDLLALGAGDPEPTEPGVLLHLEPRQPTDHERPKTHWRYVQRPCSAEEPR